MEPICYLGYHYNGFVAAHALEHSRTSCSQVHEWPQSYCGDVRAHCFHDCIYIMLS